MDKVNITTNQILETTLMIEVLGIEEARKRAYHLIVI